MPDLVRCEVRGGVAVLRMDDGKANALSPQLIADFMVALDEAEESARAVVISGRPGRFCAGFDLKVMLSGPEPAKALFSAGSDLLLRIYGLDLPVVAACTGHAMAGGALLLLAADTRIGVEGPFKLGLNEVSISMTLPELGITLAKDRLDPRRLTEAVIQARVYDPEGAVEAGYLDRVVSAERLEAEAMEAAQGLARLDRRAYAATKAAVRGASITHVRAITPAALETMFAQVVPS